MTAVNTSVLIAAETARAQAAEANLLALINAASPSIAPIPAYVQSLGSHNVTSGTTIPCATTHAVTAGHTIIAKVWSVGGTGQALSSVSGGGLTWRVQATHSNGAGPSVGIASAYCPAGLVTNTTITPTLVGGGVDSGVTLEEWFGLQDLAADAVSAGSGANTTTSLDAGSLTGTQTDNYEAFIAAWSVKEVQTSGQWTATGFTKRPVAGGLQVTLLGADTVTQGTVDPVATVTGAANMTGIAIAMKGNAVTATISLANILPGPAGDVAATRSAAAQWIGNRVTDTRDYGAKCDLTRKGGAVTSGGNVISGPTFTSGDVNKVLMLVGGGTTTTGTTGTCTVTGVTATNNILSDPNVTFTTGDVGKWFNITGAGTAGALLTGRVWGLIDAHTIRLDTTIKTTVTGTASYTLAGNLYGTITSVSGGNASINTTAGTTVTSTTSAGKFNCFYGTDDTVAIQAALNAVPANTNGLTGGTLYHSGPSAITATLNSRTSGLVVEGAGGQGTSNDLGRGSSTIMPLAPSITALTYGGITYVGANASMTSGSAVLTDLKASFAASLAGKTIWVVGAGTQVGTNRMTRLATTVTSVDSATQLTLAASAAATITNAAYSVMTDSAQLQTPPEFRNFYIQGHSECPCGLAYNSKSVRITSVTVSDVHNGVAIFGAGGPQMVDDWANLRDVMSYNSRIGYLAMSPSSTYMNGCYFDGNRNQPTGIMPGEETYGVKTPGNIVADGCRMQGFDRCWYGDGNTSGSVLWIKGGYIEGFRIGVELSSDGVNGGNGHHIAFDNIGGEGTSTTVVLNAGVKNTTIGPEGWEGGVTHPQYTVDSTCSGILIIDPGTFNVDGQTLSGMAYKALAAGPWATLPQFATAAPTTGAHVRGEMLYTSTPTSGGFIGFVCVTAGTPGTWKTFGVIS